MTNLNILRPFRPPTLTLLPALGPARRAPSRYWHERFTLPEEARVALHAVSLDPFTGIEAIVASVDKWPEPWHLVVHSRVRAEGSATVERLRALAAIDCAASPEEGKRPGVKRAHKTGEQRRKHFPWTRE